MESRRFSSRKPLGVAGTNKLLEIERGNGVGVVAANADAEGFTTSVYAWRASGNSGSDEATESAAVALRGSARSPRHRAPAQVLATLPSYDNVSFATRQLVVAREDASSIQAGHSLLLPEVGADARHAGIVCEYSHASDRTVRDYTVRFAELGAEAPAPRLLNLVEAPANVAHPTHDLIGVGAGMMFRLSLDPRTPASARNPIKLALSDELGANSCNTRCNYNGMVFTCIAATANGCVATGDIKGVVRLFSVMGRRATLSFQLGHAVRALDVTPDGAWVIVTFDSGVAAIGPFERPEWHLIDHADVAYVVCTVPPEQRATALIDDAAKYVNARIAGYECGVALPDENAHIVVALANYLVSFPLHTRPRRSSSTSARAAAAAEPRCVYSAVKRVLRARREAAEAAAAGAPPVLVSCAFSQCDLYDVCGDSEAASETTIVAHAPHMLDDGSSDGELGTRAGKLSCEMVALSDALVDMIL